jgi:Tfp pilus assembly protein PilZ
MKIANKDIRYDKRIKPRKPYLGRIFFTSKNGFYEGKLKNFSHHGLFIETKACLSVGEIITIALPHLNGKNIKCKGQVMWRNRFGCGIELFRKRSITNFRIIK